MLLGNVFIADSYNSRIRKITKSTGIISTVAGTGTASFSGDNGDATSATLYNPQGVNVDSSGMQPYIVICLQVLLIITSFLSDIIGNVYIADSLNHIIRKVAASTNII